MADNGDLPRWDDDGFRKRVAQLAAERGQSISEVCRQAGLSASYLAKLAGRSGRSIEAILRIARVLDVELNDLLGAGPMPSPRDPSLPAAPGVRLTAETVALALVQIILGNDGKPKEEKIVLPLYRRCLAAVRGEPVP